MGENEKLDGSQSKESGCSMGGLNQCHFRAVFQMICSHLLMKDQIQCPDLAD